MNIKVHYEEVANYVEKHYMIRPQLKRIDDKTLEVSCQLGRFIPPMVLQIHIELCARMLCACHTNVGQAWQC